MKLWLCLLAFSLSLISPSLHLIKEGEAALLMNNHEVEANAHSKAQDSPNRAIASVSKADAGPYTLPSYDPKDTSNRDNLTVQLQLARRSVDHKLIVEGALTRGTRIDSECEIVNVIKSPYCKVDQCANRPGVICRRSSADTCKGLGMTWTMNKDVCQDCSCRLRMAPLSITSRISEECEVVNSTGNRYCRPKDCIRRGDVLCTKTPDRCTSSGLRLAHNQDVCKQCSCRLKLQRPPQGAGDVLPKRHKRSQRTTYSQGTGGQMTVRIQRREVTDGCEIYRALKSWDCDIAQCSRIGSCRKDGVNGQRCRSFFFKSPAAKPCWGCGCRVKRKDTQALFYDSESAPTTDDCEIANPRHVPTCNPRLCAKVPGVSCQGTLGPSGSKCTGSGIRYADRNICKGCRCRNRMQRRRRRRRQKQVASKAPDTQSLSASWPSDLEMSESKDHEDIRHMRREVRFPCEITNPKGVQTCNPVMCGKRWDVYCIPGASRLTCLGTGFKVKENKDVCRGCKCNMRQKLAENKPALAHGHRKNRELGSTRDSGKTLGREVALIKRRDVTEPCQIVNPKPSTTKTCNPLSCAQRWNVHCAKWSRYDPYHC